MTYSLVGRSVDGHELGVAVASKFLAVGAVVPAVLLPAGALATQALANLRYRPDGLTALAAGGSAEQVVELLTSPDDGREHRQLGVVDGAGCSATYTGAECLPWAGGLTGPGYAIQGNLLTGPQVAQAIEQAWLATDATTPLAHRLVAALLAGDRAGGDARGRQSAAVLVHSPGGGYGGGSDVLVDLRVDDHGDPVAELARLLDLHDLLFGRGDPADALPLTGSVGAEVAWLLARLGYGCDDRVRDDGRTAGPTDAPDPADTGLERALMTYAGVENLEERLLPGHIDPRLLRFLRAGVARAGLDTGNQPVDHLGHDLPAQITTTGSGGPR